jgi:hypothetical protein
MLFLPWGLTKEGIRGSEWVKTPQLSGSPLAAGHHHQVSPDKQLLKVEQYGY